MNRRLRSAALYSFSSSAIVLRTIVIVLRTNPVNEREATPQQLNVTVIALVLSKDHYHTLFSCLLRTIGYKV